MDISFPPLTGNTSAGCKCVANPTVKWSILNSANPAFIAFIAFIAFMAFMAFIAFMGAITTRDWQETLRAVSELLGRLEPATKQIPLGAEGKQPYRLKHWLLPLNHQPPRILVHLCQVSLSTVNASSCRNQGMAPCCST